MYYGLIRIIATVILFLLLTLFLKCFKRKVNTVLGVLIAVAISLVLWYYPVENLFFSFDTPQSLFRYAGQGEIVEVVEGQESTALITKKGNNNYSTFFISKKDNKYKIATFNASKIVSSKQHGTINITVYKVRNTDDYFVRIWGISDEEIELSDTLSTEFIIHYENTANNQKTVNALISIPYFDDYSCFIGGEKITFADINDE